MSYKPKLILALTVCLLISQSMATTLYDANGVNFTLSSYVEDLLIYDIQTPVDAHGSDTWFAIVWYGNIDGSPMVGPGTYTAFLFERVGGLPASGRHTLGSVIVGDGPSFNLTGLSTPGISYYVHEATEQPTTSTKSIDVVVSGFPDFSTFNNWGCMVHTTDQTSYGYAATGSRDDIQDYMINGESYCPSTGTTSCFCGTDVTCTTSTPTDTTSEGTDIGGMSSGAFKLAMAGVTTAALANNFF